VWWRKRSHEPNQSIGDGPLQSFFSSNQVVDNSVSACEVIGWDDELSRPIYSNRQDNIVSDSYQDSSDDEDVVDVSRKSKRTFLDDMPPAPRKRRARSFGGRNRPLLSLLLHRNDQSDGSPLRTDQEDNRSAVSTQGSNNEEVSSESTEESSKANSRIKESRKSICSLRENPLPEVDQPTANSCIERARRYFDHLDSTEKLKVDMTDSPIFSSRVTRTSRRVTISSPRIIREYKAYSEASSASGVSPLSKEDFARSRREFFRPNELFDGFLDD